MKPIHHPRTIVLALLIAGLCAADRPSGAGTELHSPGDRVGETRPATAAEALPRRANVVDADFTGLYVYTTPSAQPRWLRIQQNGNVVWGTIDINSSFTMCSRVRVDGSVSGNNVSFTAQLGGSSCACSGTGASISFLGTIDGARNIIGPWTNTCGASGSWNACSTAGLSQLSTCGTLPENDPPVPIAQVPALPNRWGVPLLGMAMLLLGLGGLRATRLARVKVR